MAPYGACRVVQSIGRSSAVAPRRDYEGAFERVFERSVEQARPSSDFERTVAPEHARAVISSAQWHQSMPEQ